MRVSTIGRTLFCLIFLHDSLSASAGIDWSRYDDGPVFFLGWETSFYFAIGAAILYGLSWLLSENNKDEKGNLNDDVGCLVSIINVAMIICAICSYYLLIPLLIIYTLIKSTKK